MGKLHFGKLLHFEKVLHFGVLHFDNFLHFTVLHFEKLLHFGVLHFEKFVYFGVLHFEKLLHFGVLHFGFMHYIILDKRFFAIIISFRKGKEKVIKDCTLTLYRHATYQGILKKVIKNMFNFQQKIY